MPRYFFHIRHPDGLVPDEEGAEFEDLGTAKIEAVESVRDIAIDTLRRGDKIHGLAIEVADGAGKVLHTIRAWETFD